MRESIPVVRGGLDLLHALSYFLRGHGMAERMSEYPWTFSYQAQFTLRIKAETMREAEKLCQFFAAGIERYEDCKVESAVVGIGNKPIWPWPPESVST